MRTFAEESRFSQKTARVPSLVASQVNVPRRSGTSRILDLQRTLGNRAVARMLATGELSEADYSPPISTSGVEKREAEKSGLNSSSAASISSIGNNMYLAGDQADESETSLLAGDPDNGVPDTDDSQPQSTVMGGDATSINTGNLSAPAWGNSGQFKWWIKWVTDGTSGWIVQRIDNTYSGTRADGTPITNAGFGLPDTYYEAWEVASDGTITGSLGGTGNRDRWERPNLGALGSTLNLSIKGTTFWTSKDPASSGFKSGAVAAAGSLLSSTSPPAGLSSALLTRTAHGMWTSDGSTALPGCFIS